MDIKAKTNFQSTYHGHVEQGQVLRDVPSDLARLWIDAGIADKFESEGKPVKRYYNTKVVGDAPQVGDVPLASGQESASSSSQAAQASPKKTRKNSKAKKSSS